MAAITAYTDTDVIRGLLGLGPIEVPDDMLLNMQLQDRVLVDLSDWLPDHSAQYAAWSAVAAPETEQGYARMLRLFSSYFCAACVADFQLAVPHSIGDGKNVVRRFEGVDFAELAERMAAQASYYRSRLEEALNASERARLTLLGRAIPGYDPVTGAGRG